MRDRLIELMTDAPCGVLPPCFHDKEVDCSRRVCSKCNEQFADYLLANGVIVPPCKVGDTVYVAGKFTKQILSFKVSSISYSESDMWLICDNGAVVSVAEQIGKTVFLTREEAERALQEGKK